jgi:putative methionine-R-sulfoxide reductase with GAF domain
VSRPSSRAGEPGFPRANRQSPPALDSRSPRGETRFNPFAMNGSAQPEDRFPAGSTGDTTVGTDRPASVGAGGDNSNGSRAFGETELDSALQLLVERAQYITGATGTALALPQGEEMVCRASAGSSAPAVGARLQVRSGLTGESIARRQLLRCDNAETDPRVNLETCRALGIASIVVLPLLRRGGEVRGLFELFSDHPYAFEERDLIALERMADLTLTALDLAEQRQNFAPAPRREPENPVPPPAAGSAQPIDAIPIEIPTTPEFAEPTVPLVEPTVVLTEPPVVRAEPTVFPAGLPVVPAEPVVLPAEPSVDLAPEPVPASVPDAMLRVQKCASCGFPVSEGRTLCLDCEKKDTEKTAFEKKQREQEQGEIVQQIEQQKIEQEIYQDEQEQGVLSDSVGASAATSVSVTPEEFVPAFLANAVPPRESWLADHVNLLAVVVLILGILVAVVVFR